MRADDTHALAHLHQRLQLLALLRREQAFVVPVHQLLHSRVRPGGETEVAHLFEHLDGRFDRLAHASPPDGSSSAVPCTVHHTVYSTPSLTRGPSHVHPSRRTLLQGWAASQYFHSTPS